MGRNERREQERKRRGFAGRGIGSMKAYLLRAIGDFTYADVERPVCADDEVVVRVAAAGVCGSDIPRIYRSGAYSYPLIPGHEFAGTVAEAGKKADGNRIGKRVGVYPLIPCRKCGPCEAGQYELCRSYSYLGSRRAGGFAEYVAVPEWNLIELPEGVSFEQAAMLEPMAVALHAVRRSKIKRGQSAAICGLGTIGLLVYMILADMGLERIFLVGNKEYQREAAAGLGFDTDYFCNNSSENGDEWLTGMRGWGVGAFFDCAGTAESAGLAVRHTAPGGTVMLVGNPASDMTFDRNTYWKILRNQLTVKGTWNSAFKHEDRDDWHRCLDLTAGKKVMPEKLVSHRLSLDRLAWGTELMRDKKENYTKVMVLF